MSFENAFVHGPMESQAVLYAQIHQAVEQIVSAALAQARAAARAAPAPADDDTRLALLSAREREVLRYIAAGHGNKAIARELDLSLHTVKRHVANILCKLDVASRGQAAAWLRDRG